MQLLGFILYKDAFLRNSTESFDHSYFIQVVYLLPEFISTYFKEVLVNHKLLLFILLLQIIILKRSGLYNENKSIINYLLCVLVSILIFFFSLIGLGKSHYDGGFWTCHIELNITMNIILFTIALVFSKVIFQLLKEKQKKHFGVFAASVVTFFVLYNIVAYKEICTDMYFLKKDMYISEKISRFAYKQNKVAVLSDELLDSKVMWPFYPVDDNLDFIPNVVAYTIYNNSYFVRYLKYFEHKEWNFYYKFVSEEEAMDEFAKSGGSFVNEELKELKFTKLLKEL